MPNIMNMQALGGMSQNVPIVMPGYVGGGTAANVNSGQLQAQLRRAFGVDLPPTIDVTMLLSPALPAAIMPASAFTTPVFKSCGASQVAAALTLSQGGNVVLNRFLDPIGAILSTSATQAATANAQCLLDSGTTSLFQSWNLVVTNTAASGATLSSFSAVLGK